MAAGTRTVIDVAGLQSLIELLRADGWAVIGPAVSDGVVRHAEIRSIDDLPRGVGDEQDGAHYRLRRRTDDALFGYAVGAPSWKPLLLPAHHLMRRVRPGDANTAEAAHVEPPPRRALFGVRSCDLQAIEVLDGVLRDRPAADADYVARRANTFIVAVACAEPGGTCFCASMGTGPAPQSGYDLALTELLDDDGHRFVVSAGSERGTELLSRLPGQAADTRDEAAAEAVVTRAVGRMGRSLDTTGIRELLYANPEHPQWDDVAARCLSCGNCTLVCPTCFCTTIEDTTDLATGSAERWRRWDSCFTTEFSHLNGGSVRTTTRTRYRHWVTHKLAAWWDQFDSSGCVGCGRCITWCPVGIDLTAEVAAVRAATAPLDPDTLPEA